MFPWLLIGGRTDKYLWIVQSHLGQDWKPIKLLSYALKKQIVTGMSSFISVKSAHDKWFKIQSLINIQAKCMGKQSVVQTKKAMNRQKEKSTNNS